MSSRRRRAGRAARVDDIRRLGAASQRRAEVRRSRLATAARRTVTRSSKPGWPVGLVSIDRTFTGPIPTIDGERP